MQTTTQYIVKRVFIASPSDLGEERTLIRDVIDEINQIKANSVGLHLDVIGWENTLEGLGRPQARINQDLATAHLFLMMLWTRWGTPSGEFSSGTEEEFYESLKLYQQYNRPDMWVYFKEVAPETERTEDIQRIEDFRKTIEEKKLLMYKRISTKEDLERKLRLSLAKWIDGLLTLETQSQVSPTPTQSILPDMLPQISYSWITIGSRKAEIYFTLINESSLHHWNRLSQEEKKVYLYNQLATYLYLTLGADIYTGIMRFWLADNTYIFLGVAKFTYENYSSYKDTDFYIPPDNTQIITQTEPEETLFDFHNRNSLYRNKGEKTGPGRMDH